MILVSEITLQRKAWKTMNSKVYKLMDWPAIEALQYGEEDQPQKVLGAHVSGRSMLYQAYLPGAVKVDVVLDDEDKTAAMDMVDEDGFFAAVMSHKTPKKYHYVITDAEGNSFKGYGLYAAVSFDEGKTWPVKRLITDGEYRLLNGGAWTQFFEMDATHAEPRGYLACTQTPDNMIHLISSRLHYRFNLAWLMRK